MKLKRNKLYIQNIIVPMLVGLLMFSCAEFEKYESKTLAPAPTVSATITSVGDSTVTVSIGSTTSGYVSYAIFEGTGTAVPSNDDLIELNVIAHSSGSGKISEGNGSILEAFGGLVQNTSYELFAVGQNSDGNLSDVVGPIAIKTSDHYAPVLTAASPGPSTSAVNPVGFTIELTYDEPVQLNTSKKFVATYLFDGITTEVTDVEALNNIVSVTLPSDVGHTGDYVFLSIEAGAVTDFSGNEANAISSGIDNEGYPVGLYFRHEKVAWDVVSMEPADESTLTDNTFAVELVVDVTGVDLSSSYESTMIQFTFENDLSTTTFNVSEDYIFISGDTITIYKPSSPNYGDVASVTIAEGAFTDMYGNPIAETVASWPISYGYTIDMITGSYQVACTSYYGSDYDATFSVTIETTDNENEVLITGLFDGTVGVLGMFDGDGAILTIETPQELGDLYGDGAVNTLEDGAGTGYFELNIDSDGNLLNGVFGAYYDGEGDDEDGWINYFTNSTWTKATSTIAKQQPEFTLFKSTELVR